MNKFFLNFVSWFHNFWCKRLFTLQFLCTLVSIYETFNREDKTNDSMADAVFFSRVFLLSFLSNEIQNPCVPSVFTKWMNFAELAKKNYYFFLFNFICFIFYWMSVYTFRLNQQKKRVCVYYNWWTASTIHWIERRQAVFALKVVCDSLYSVILIFVHFSR